MKKNSEKNITNTNSDQLNDWLNDAEKLNDLVRPFKNAYISPDSCYRKNKEK